MFSLSFTLTSRHRICYALHYPSSGLNAVSLFFFLCIRKHVCQILCPWTRMGKLQTGDLLSRRQIWQENKTSAPFIQKSEPDCTVRVDLGRETSRKRAAQDSGAYRAKEHCANDFKERMLDQWCISSGARCSYQELWSIAICQRSTTPDTDKSQQVLAYRWTGQSRAELSWMSGSRTVII
jgi:hypothetical protein